MRELALALALALLVPGAAAQTLDGQVTALAEHAEATAEDTVENPQAMAANATNASWQARQANWTLAWSCDTVSAVDEDAGDRVRNLTGCPESEDAAAGQDPAEEQGEENATVAQVEELGNDTATAVEDQVAATEALVNDTLAEPGQAPSHLEAFLNRTLILLERLVGGPWALVEQAVGTVQEVAQDVGRLADELLDGVQELGVQLAGVPVDGARWAQAGITSVADSVTEGADRAASGISIASAAITEGVTILGAGTTDAVASMVDGLETGIASVTDAIARVLDRSNPIPGEAQDEGTMERAAGDALDEVVSLPVQVEVAG